MSNEQSSFHVIYLKLDVGTSPPNPPAAANDIAARCLQHAARWSQLVERSDEYLCTGGACCKHVLE